MKRAFFLTLSLVLSIAANAQFKCVPGGFVSVADGKPYVVFLMDGTQAELYQKAKTVLTSMFISAKDVISYNEPDIIVANGFAPTNPIKCKALGITSHLGLKYRVELQFKDGKVRVDAPQVDILSPSGDTGYYSIYPGGTGGTYHFYKKDGKPRQKEGIASLENYINNLVNVIIGKIKGAGIDDDW